MSTEPNNTDRTNGAASRLLNRAANTFIHSDSIHEASRTAVAVEDDNNSQPLTWVDSLAQLDRALSGGLLRLCNSVIDIVLLSYGLYYGTKTCSISHAYAFLSIFILVFDAMAIATILLLFPRNWRLRHTTLSEETTSNPYRTGTRLRNFFYFLRFISVCTSTAYVFTSKKPPNNDCELIRFYLGVVCFNTWVIFLNWPPKPSLPARRSLIGEITLFLFSIIYNGIYFGCVAFAMSGNNEQECEYNRIEDLYFRAPLKSFAYVGLILIVCRVCNNLLYSAFNRLFYRLTTLRTFFIRLAALHYLITYLLGVTSGYYYSVGAVLLFQPRSGGSCSIVAPKLYTVLFVWELIIVFSPLVIWCVLIILCCLGAVLGVCLASCLPASITVPLLRAMGGRLHGNTGTPHENPPASPATIDALPMIFFGQASDEFNQKECAICQSDYEPNEKAKRLPCGHIFHEPCVAHWLSITRICPVCRHRIPSTGI
ncbi:unnamed protein product [Rotaria socialis]|uniref:RING-type domain-containing protein n=1 Tax=Rotaria socialis TaxID=392032 RepID=A0A821MMC7_9BILA|nr:unnamed protein product [Rotaria socialis]CAF3423781.1 unnamed protein product [Rotaria socialis]CAF3447008.1 unnamed protein product [Rotaria socialis]CAF3588373.1 unnamed protein product [Rotaria socialis]CAF4372070.1 unnamed protein product [Rotaria socialis]